MKSCVLLLALLPLALGWPEQKGWGGGSSSEEREERDGGSNEMQQMRDFFQKLMQMREEREGSHEESEEGDPMMGQMWERLQKMYERKQKRDRFQRWMEEERKEREERERREHQLEEMQRRQMMVQKMTNLSLQLQHQKARLVHDVTFQFLQFCQCKDTSAMVQKLFTHRFGDLSYMEDWRSAMEGAVEGEWFTKKQDWSDDSGEKKDDNDGQYTTRMPPRNGTSSNSSQGGNQGNFTTTPRPDGNEDTLSVEQRAKYLKHAQKFAAMTQMEQSKELFQGMITSLCQRAGEFVRQVQSFETFYAQWKVNRNH